MLTNKQLEGAKKVEILGENYFKSIGFSKNSLHILKDWGGSLQTTT